MHALAQDGLGLASSERIADEVGELGLHRRLYFSREGVWLADPRGEHRAHRIRALALAPALRRAPAPRKSALPVFIAQARPGAAPAAPPMEAAPPPAQPAAGYACASKAALRRGIKGRRGGRAGNRDPAVCAASSRGIRKRSSIRRARRCRHRRSARQALDPRIHAPGIEHPVRIENGLQARGAGERSPDRAAEAPRSCPLREKASRDP